MAFRIQSVSCKGPILVPLVFSVVAFALFCVFAFSCDAFKLHVEGRHAINRSYTYNYGFWRSQLSHQYSCHNYAEQGTPVDAAIRFGRFAGALGAVLGTSLILFLIARILVDTTPKNNNVGIIVAAVFMYVMALLNVLLLVGLAHESCTEEDYIYCAPDLGYTFIPSMILYIGAGIWMTMWWRRQESTKAHRPTTTTSPSLSPRVSPAAKKDEEAAIDGSSSSTTRAVETFVHADGSKTVTTTTRTVVVLDAHAGQKIQERTIRQIPSPSPTNSNIKKGRAVGQRHNNWRNHPTRRLLDVDETAPEEQKEEFDRRDSV